MMDGMMGGMMDGMKIDKEPLDEEFLRKEDRLFDRMDKAAIESDWDEYLRLADKHEGLEIEYNIKRYE